MSHPSRRAALLLLLVAVGCGGATTAGLRAPIPETSMPLLSTSAIPGIPSKTIELTTTILAQDVSIPQLSSDLSSWGYLAGRQRTFQGESRHLSFAVSRALVFGDASGARSYLNFVHEHATAFFGIATQTQRLVEGASSGWRFTPSPCACHLAEPSRIGVVSAGPLVVWLEINGPDATPALLSTLLDPVLGVVATPSG